MAGSGMEGALKAGCELCQVPAHQEAALLSAVN